MKNEQRSEKRIYRWRKTLEELTESTGITFEEVCEYAGIKYNPDGVSFYLKIPKKKRTFIGIGMAYHQPLEVINEWIMRYGNKKRLYARDISEDLVWIYLINTNASSQNPGDKNLFKLYDSCQAAAYAIWQEMWDGMAVAAKSTSDVEIELAEVDYDEAFVGLKDFVANNIDSFKTAYDRPRFFLDKYVNQILETCRNNPEKTGIRRINDLRGFLDDSMINYLSGDSGSINVIDLKSHRQTIQIKHVPKLKKTHISLCLALGMRECEINEYLELLGFMPLDDEDQAERELINTLNYVGSQSRLVHLYKDKYFGGKTDIMLDSDEEFQAVEEMLFLRQKLQEEYKKRGMQFPYMKW